MKARIKNSCIHIYIGQLALLAVLSAGWWGILYPNFSITEDTFHAVADEAAAENDNYVINEGEREAFGPWEAEGFFDMLEAAPGEIRIKSRLLDTISEIRGKADEQ